MKNIKRSATPLLTPSNNLYAAYFLAQEKTAWLDAQLNLAKEAADNLIDDHSFIYWRLSTKFAVIGKAIDHYAIYLVGLAMQGKSLDDQGDLQAVDKKFLDFFLHLDTFFTAIKRGSLPLTSPLGKAIWRGPRELLSSIQNLQQTGCLKFLETKDTDFEDTAPHSHAHSLHVHGV